MDFKDHKDNDTMCILPWIHMHPWPNGKTMLCCDSPWEHNIGDLRENSLQEVWNSERMKQIRLNMLKGKKSKECVRSLMPLFNVFEFHEHLITSLSMLFFGFLILCIQI